MAKKIDSKKQKMTHINMIYGYNIIILLSLCVFMWTSAKIALFYAGMAIMLSCYETSKLKKKLEK